MLGYNMRYDAFDNNIDKITEKPSTKIIIYADKEYSRIDEESIRGIDITFKNIKNTWSYINEKLLGQDIHLDFNMIRNYLRQPAAAKNMFDVGDKPIMLIAESDINGTTAGFVPTYSINLKTSFDRGGLVERLNNVMKANNKI